MLILWNQLQLNLNFRLGWINQSDQLPHSISQNFATIFIKSKNLWIFLNLIRKIIVWQNLAQQLSLFNNRINLNMHGKCIIEQMLTEALYA